MATISSIGTSLDYTTPQAWEDAIPASLVDIYIGELNNQAFSGSGQQLLISGHTGESASQYIHLRCQSSESFADDDTNNLKFDTANGASIEGTGGYIGGVIENQEGFTRIQGVMIKSGAGNSVTVYNTGDAFKLYNCVVSGANNEIGKGIVQCNTTNHQIWNNLIVFETAPGSNSAGISCDGGGTSEVSNNTVVNPSNQTAAGNGIHCGYSRSSLYCNASYGFTNAFAKNGTSAYVGDYNATDDTTAIGGANDVTSDTYSSTAPFADADDAADYDFKSNTSGSLDSAGTQRSITSDLDIFGHSRSASTPWIGCYEPAAGGPTTANRLTLLGVG